MSKVYHRGQDPRNSTDIVLWVDDQSSIESYGDAKYSININCLVAMPEWVQDYAESYYRDCDSMRPNVNPDNIVDSADCWDDRDFVSSLWSDNEDTLLSLMDNGIYGFKTVDGAVTFSDKNIPVIVG